MHLTTYLKFLDASLERLGDAYRDVGTAHGDEPDVRILCTRFAQETDGQRQILADVVRGYGEEHGAEDSERPGADLFQGPRTGPIGLLHDMGDLYLLASLCHITWTLVGQAAQAARDTDLHAAATTCESTMSTQLKWLRTRLKSAAPQALLMAS